jgi:hypothetical protein
VLRITSFLEAAVDLDMPYRLPTPTKVTEAPMSHGALLLFLEDGRGLPWVAPAICALLHMFVCFPAVFPKLE